MLIIIKLNNNETDFPKLSLKVNISINTLISVMNIIFMNYQ